MISISYGEIRNRDTQNHSRIFIQANLSFSQKSTTSPSGRHSYGHNYNSETWKSPERILSAIWKTWIFLNNRKVKPQGYTWNDFNARIHKQNGAKSYPEYKIRIFYEFENFWKKSPLPSPLRVHGWSWKPKHLNSCILKSPQSKFQASKFIRDQMGPKSKKGWAKNRKVSRGPVGSRGLFH